MTSMEKQEKKSVIPELTISAAEKKKVDVMIQSTNNEVTDYWSDEITEEIYVPIDVGEIRVLHVKPKQPKNKTIIVFIPGWGTINSEFNDLYEALHTDVEFYYIETREKSTSNIRRRKTTLTLSDKAKDVQKVIDFCKLNEREFVLSGTCWGASVILIGLDEKSLTAPRIVLFDPAAELSFSKFIVTISIVIPTFLIKLLKKILKFIVLRNMKDERQRERNGAFIDNAVVWKWKRSAFQNRKLNLFKILPKIEKEILIFNGSKDKFHPQEIYPAEAKTLPNGRFFFLKVEEGFRERMFGAVLREFALFNNETKVPLSLLDFEKKLDRDKKKITTN